MFFEHNEDCKHDVPRWTWTIVTSHHSCARFCQLSAINIINSGSLICNNAFNNRRPLPWKYWIKTLWDINEIYGEQFLCLRVADSWADPERRTGSPDPPPPPEKSQNVGFLSNTGLNPLKYTKLPSQHSLLGHHRHASETPFKYMLLFKWRFACRPMKAEF